MPTPGQISKENLKQILVFFPAVVYNICVVLFSFQLNYTTQKRICPACGLQILFCLLGAFFHSPLFRSSISHAVPIAPRLSLDSVAAALDRGDFESGSDSKSGRLTSDALFPLHRSLRRRGGGLRAGFFWGLFFFVYGLQRHFFCAAFFYSFLLYRPRWAQYQ